MPPATEQFGSLAMTVLNGEHSRTYIYAAGAHLEINDVTHLHVKRNENGTHTHRLRTGEGDMYYIPPGWIAICFPDLEGWTL